MRETHHQSAPRETVREVPTEEGDSKPMTLPSRLLKRASKYPPQYMRAEAPDVLTRPAMRNQLESQVWPQLGLTAKQKERLAERERAKADAAARVRDEAGGHWPLR